MKQEHGKSDIRGDKFIGCLVIDDVMDDVSKNHSRLSKEFTEWFENGEMKLKDNIEVFGTRIYKDDITIFGGNENDK